VRTRSFISAMMLLVQVLGLGHLALAAHTVSNTGTVVDAAELSAEAHSHPAEHLCAGDVNVHAQNAGDECVVVASFKTANLTVTPFTAWLDVAPDPQQPSFTNERREPALAVLFVAPKASPPQR
jgi:hypothetical protein